VGVREVIGGTVEPRGTVVVVDDEHRSQALSAAIVLAARGCAVTFLTDRTGPAELMEPAVRNDMLLALRGSRFSIHPSRRVLSLHQDDGRVRVRTEEAALDKLVYAVTTTAATEDIEADWVVSTFVEPEDELFAQLRRRHDVRMVGDVLNPHRIEGAVHGGFALAAEI
jgi:2,4-dienoyl-CoA reductase (NADPH2)